MTVSDTIISLAWTPAGVNAGSQYVQYRRAGASVWVTFNTEAPGSTVRNVTGLSARTEYEFRVVNANVAGASSAIVRARTDASAPPAPSYPAPNGLNGSATAYNRVDVSWVRQGTTNDAMDIEVDGVVNPAGQLGAAANAYAHTGLAPQSAHTYRVRQSYNGGANKSEWTAPLSVTTPPAPFTNDPSNLSAVATGYFSVRANWTNNGPVDQTLQYRWQGDTTWTSVGSVGAVSTYTIGGLADGTTYDVRVRATAGTNWIQTSATTPTYVDPDPYCVTLDTLILAVTDGGRRTWVPAGEVRAGDFLVTVDAEGRANASRVRAVVPGRTTGVYTLRTDGGYSLSCSPSHPILTGYGNLKGKAAAAFQPGDSILTLHASSSRAEEGRVHTVEFMEARLGVVTFEMEADDHTFVSQGIVSHNIRNKL